MTDQLKGKIALVTGGSSGIGKAAARLFAREGAKVVIADIDAEGASRTLQAIHEKDGEAHFVQADISKAADVEAMVGKVIELHGRLDCAYNNAGIMGDIMSVVDQAEEIWDNTIGTNLKGTWLCMKYEIPQMLKQGHGAIVNTTATSGLKGGKYRSAYAASKAGIVSLTKTAAMEYVEYGLRINVICPSHTRTPNIEQFFELRPELEADYIAQGPMGRLAAPEEVANGALWLCSDAASFVTGHVLAVDGGFLSR